MFTTPCDRFLEGLGPWWIKTKKEFSDCYYDLAFKLFLVWWPIHNFFMKGTKNVD